MLGATCIHRGLARMHKRIDHRGELLVNEERRTKTPVLLDVPDDVVHPPDIKNSQIAGISNTFKFWRLF